MLIEAILLLIFNQAYCFVQGPIVEEKIVSPGEDVRFACERSNVPNLVWIRLGRNNSLNVFGGSGFKNIDLSHIQTESSKTDRLTRLSLHLSKVKADDTAVFICLSTTGNKWNILKRVELTVKDASKQVNPEICPPPRLTRDIVASCFPPEKFQSRPGSVYTEGTHEYDCEDEHEGQLRTKCVYSFFMNISLSGGLWSVTSCGERSDPGPAEKFSGQLTNTIVSLTLGAALILSLVVIIFLLHSKKKLTNAAALQAETDQNHEADSVTYSTPTHFRNRPRDKRTRNVRPQEEQCIYTSVRTNH